MEELKVIMEKFAASGWELIAVPARGWLEGHRPRRAGGCDPPGGPGVRQLRL